MKMWFGVLAGPLAWAMHEGVSYALVKVACSGGLLVLEHGITALALALAVAGAYVSARSYAAYRRDTPRAAVRATDQPEGPPTPQGVGRFGPEGTSVNGDAVGLMAPLGVLSAALFAFAILMEALPDVVLSPCM